jgi:N-acetyl-alpha-D-muramate 1-phosphate uridylyltransferase
MADSVAGVVLAAGGGTRLRPLTGIRPKALCPVVNVPLVDHAVRRLAQHTPDIAVNVHHGREPMEQHLAGRVHLSIEEGHALGTAGALAHLRAWLDGRAALVTNVDAYLPASSVDVVGFVEGWDRERVRLLVVEDDARPDFSGTTYRYAGLCAMPSGAIARLPDDDGTPAGLYETTWRAAHEQGDVDFVVHDGTFIDCGTPGDYLAANLHASGGENVVGPGALVEGELVRSVVWPGAVVYRAERLVDGIKATELAAVLVR